MQSLINEWNKNKEKLNSFIWLKIAFPGKLQSGKQQLKCFSSQYFLFQ